MQHLEIDKGRNFDWGRTAKDYARFRNVYPASFYRKLRQFGIGIPGQRVLDFGTGTGIIAINLSRTGVALTGIDVSPDQIAVARIESADLKPPIEWLVRDARDTGLPEDTFDAITAVQCWLYFDPLETVREAYRLLHKHGLICVAFMAWLPEEDEITAESIDLVSKYNPERDPGPRHRHVPGKLDTLGDGFALQTFHTYDPEIEFTRESWTGRMRTCRGIGASLPQEAIEAFCVEHMKMLEKVPSPFVVKHQVVYNVYYKK